MKKIISTFLLFCFIITSISLPRMSVSAADYSSYSNTEVDWGLSLKKDHTAPAGTYPAGVDIKQYDAYYIGDANENDPVVYLTFDCGYENGNTPTILDVLKENKIKAIFFVTKPFVTQNPDLVKRMKREGHLVGNHTATHPNLTTKTPEQIQAELNDTADLMKELTGYEMDKYMRPPAGQYSERVLKVMQDMGYKTIFWSLAWLDYDVNNQPSVSYVVDRFVTYHFNGLIPLMHNTSTADTAALPEVIRTLKSNGYRFGTLDEIGKRDSSVTISIKKKTAYTGDAVKATVKKKTGDGKVKFIYYDSHKKKLKSAPSEPGTYYVKAKMAATDKYKKAVSKTKKFKIVKAEGEIEIEMEDAVLPDVPDPVATVVTGDYEDFTFIYYDESGTKLSQKPDKAGSYTVKAKAGATDHYKKCESDTAEFTVTEKLSFFQRAIAWFLGRFFGR